MTVYYFDTLPVHPQPAYLESLTSYLTRLAEANGLTTIRDLFKLSFPTEPVRLSFQTGDFPPASFGGLPTLAQCGEERLFATTFYHLGKKFNKILRPRPLAQFLSGSIAYRFLRYCPVCVAERGYYSLLWRFLTVEGCPHHGCRLLDVCTHCGQQLPLLALLPKLGVCSRCGGDLKICQTEQLSSNLHQSLVRCCADLSYLISPQSCELNEVNLTQMIGERFGSWRRAKYLKGIDIARSLELSVTILRSIESGQKQYPVKFHRYVEYADFLQISFKKIFTGAIDYPLDQTDEEPIIQQMEQAIALLEQQGQPVTQQTVVQLVEGSLAIFNYHPQVRAWWDAYKSHRKQQREAVLVNSVQQAIDQLRQQGQKVSRSAVCKMIGLSYEALRLYHPVAWEIVDVQSDFARSPSSPKQQVSRQPGTRYQREDELLKKVELAIQSLQQQDKSVSQRTVAKVVGISGAGLWYYPRIRALLKASKLQLRERNEDELCDKIQAALATLLQTGDQVTITAVSRMVGVSLETLNTYPRVRALLNRQIKQKYQIHLRQHRQHREADLVKKVTQAIELLQTNETKVTQIAISQIVQMSSVNLKRYPKVNRLLRQSTGLGDPSHLLVLQQPEEV